MKKDLFITLLICSIYNAQAQYAYLKEETNLLQNGKFGDALTLSEQVKYGNKSCEVVLLYGMANNPMGKFESALSFLQGTVRPGFISVSRKYSEYSKYSPGLNDDASANYSVYLSGIEPKHKDFNCCKNYIYRGEKDIVFKSDETFGFAEPAGKVINFPNDEFRLIQRSNFLNKFSYSSNKLGLAHWPHNKFGVSNHKYCYQSFDMYEVESEESSRQPEFIFSEDQNTSENKILYAFNPNGCKFIIDYNFYA